MNESLAVEKSVYRGGCERGGRDYMDGNLTAEHIQGWNAYMEGGLLQDNPYKESFDPEYKSYSRWKKGWLLAAEKDD